MAESVQNKKRYIVYMTEEEKEITCGIFNFHGWDVEIYSDDDTCDKGDDKILHKNRNEKKYEDSKVRQEHESVHVEEIVSAEAQGQPVEGVELEESLSGELCPYCLSSPCVTANPQAWLGTGRPPLPGNNTIRKKLYRKYWTMLDRRGLWYNRTYLDRKNRLMQDAHVELTVREIMPGCVLEQVRNLYPNPKDVPYMVYTRMNPEQQLHLAVKEKDVKKIEELLNNGVDINCLFYGLTPLQHAISLGLEEITLLLIDKGADIHKIHHKTDDCPLEGAIKKRLPKVLKSLIDKGTDPNAILSDGNPAIFTAVEKEYADILKILIEGKADPNLLNKGGESALFISSRDGKSKLVQVLIDGGADMDFQCAEAGNQTSLIIATANEQNSVVKLLLKNRCNIDLQDNDEWTALWHAYSNSDEDMMNLLLKSGADKTIPDSDGRTLLQDAQENDDDSVVELLQRFTRSWTK